MQPRKSRVSARPRRPRHFRGSNPGRRCLRRRKHHRRDVRHGQGLLRASGGRVGYAVTGCALGLCSLARLAGIPTPHPARVRGSCFDLARGSSFSCFGVRPATLANLSFELVPARWPCCIAAFRQHKHCACHFSAYSAIRACPRFLLVRADGIVRRSLVRLSPRAIFAQVSRARPTPRRF